eukprot:scaffold2442_cov146-Cylindrotheca_fusiformis.AAC.15
MIQHSDCCGALSSLIDQAQPYNTYSEKATSFRHPTRRPNVTLSRCIQFDPSGTPTRVLPASNFQIGRMLQLRITTNRLGARSKES